ncbi:MAG: acylneuraminate cytidylyltransferase family protein [Lachnospiraceae bacterium]|nr:acylneuraminate cytidylyltransferase family protein [Lachnospiraceae bacterium]
MEILSIIPARGGSKGIPKKNMALLCGQPLIKYTFDAAKKSRLITRIILSTDDKDFAEYGRENGIEALMRPEELAGDRTPMKDVINYHLDALEKSGYKCDILILLQPTSPLRTEKHIDQALQGLIDEREADATVSVVDVPHEYLPQKLMELKEDGSLKFFRSDGEKYTTRQELPHLYARNGAAVYAVYTESYRKTGSLYGTRCIPYFMKPEESVDVDGYFDLFLAECIMRDFPEWKEERFT